MDNGGESKLETELRSGSTFARVSPNLKASLLIIGAFTVFCAMAVLIRLVGDTIPVVEVIFVRQALSFVLMALWFWRAAEQIRKPRGLKLHLARGFLAVGAMSCGLTATLLIPLADVTAIQMSEVLMATALAAILLGEPVGWRRWSAALVGFVGVAIMVQPFGGGFEVASLIALLGAFCGAGSMIAIRMGSSHDNVSTVLFWQGIVVLAIVTPITAFFWVTPSLHHAALLGLMSLLFTLGGYLFTAGLRIGTTSAIAPLHYLRLVMMAVLGLLVYGEVPTLATIIGGVLVLAAATYTLTRNAKLAIPRGTGEPQV